MCPGAWQSSRKWPVKGADPRGCGLGASPPGGEPGSPRSSQQEDKKSQLAFLQKSFWPPGGRSSFGIIMLPLSLFKKRKRDREREREMRGREIEGKRKTKIGDAD